MTNRSMVKPSATVKANTTPLPPMPAPEDSTTPTTTHEPTDSPQPNASAAHTPGDKPRPKV
ncbi:hypothetical protein [Methylobacterium organophilum]|uniref:Uncharacterized protein n=1 Tax=Methylobacterium organophilum TaxID=410 RepID=A0ABQ4T5D8_METOR|nr:hypothetical protein [Methylobacterium organophilum]GJE26135.1 hypothetical protein LKMONMHP_0981 [Methylobacterium organophilum]